MTTEYFKVRNGLTVGEDAFTADATTGNVVVTGTLNVTSNVIIDGNITINGDSTTLNTTELAVEDNKITLNKNATGAPTLNSGIVVERGDSTDSELTWNESTDKWEQNRGGVATVIPISTTELAEGTNQYFTTQRAVDAVEAAGYATETQLSAKLNTADFTSTADTWLGGKTTDNLAEGATNKYYTDARVRTEINAGNPGSFVNLTASGVVELLTDTVVVGDDTVTGYQGLEFNTLGKTAHLVIDNATGKLIYSRDNITWTPVPQSTAELAENTNLYYTDARVGSYLVSNSYATQGYVSTQVANLVASAPTTLDTLNELAEALGDDPNFATTVTTALGTKLATADFTTTANSWLATKTTDNLGEGSTNRYFSNTLARGAISAGTGVGYDSGTGVISIGQAVGTGNSPAFAGITAGNLTVGVATDNSIVSTDTNGNITLAPNGTGDVALTFNTGGNLTNNRNYVLGAIRNATTDNTNGDIWELNTSAVQGAANPYFRGVSLDNSGDTTRGPANLMRSYSGGAVSGSAQRGRLIFEKARGTAASPTAVQSGDILGSIDVTGYTSTGWLNDTIPAVTGFFGFTASESYVSNTNLGTQFNLSLAPTATTISTGANLVQTLNINPQTFASRSDAFTWANGKTGTTQTMSLDVSGNLIVTGDVRINGNDIQGSGGASAITLTSANTATTIRGDAINLQTAASASIVGSSGIVYNRVYGQWQYDATLTPVAINTAYAVPFQGTNAVTDFANIASAASTSRIIPGAAGMFKLQFSAQVQNADNAADHTAYFWWRKNGTDITASMGRVTIVKGTAGGLQIVGWDNMISSANTTDYFELMYAVDDLNVTIPYFASTAFGPATASVFLTLVPIGA